MPLPTVPSRRPTSLAVVLTLALAWPLAGCGDDTATLEAQCAALDDVVGAVSSFSALESDATVAEAATETAAISAAATALGEFVPDADALAPVIDAVGTWTTELGKVGPDTTLGQLPASATNAAIGVAKAAEDAGDEVSCPQ